jgi:hypothetical protein
MLPSVKRKSLTCLRVVRDRLVTAGIDPTTEAEAERLLERVQRQTLIIIREDRRRRYHRTPLSTLQQRMLTLLNCPVNICTRLCANFRTSPCK